MPLPTCICVAGRPPFDRLGDIFCALTQIDLECVIPTLLSATIVGDEVTLVFDRNVTGQSGFTVFINGVNDGITYVSGEGTSVYVYTTGTPAEAGDDVLLNYNPGDVAQRECALVEIEEFPVTNNTGLQFTYVQPDGFAYFQPDGVSLYLQP